jgi:formylglycine-generating enzyme required for sulfatase activity
MVHVEGEHCPHVVHTCLTWLDDETLPYARCAEYRVPSECRSERTRMSFCIDRTEYTPPEQDRPLNHQSYHLGHKLCGSQGKRLCTEEEWNFACEGEAMQPYPYGFSREPKCNQDREDLFEENPRRQVLRDLRDPPASRAECVSPFGVFDMVGNLDEPVVRSGQGAAYPFRSALKGGWWMPGRNRCRAATTAHDEFYKGIQVGVRCCSDLVEAVHAAPSANGKAG